MSLVEIINALLGAGFVVLGWFARELWSAVKTLKEDLIQLREDMTDNFTRKDDFRDFREETRSGLKDFRGEILSFLQRIETKLDTKQDKHGT